VIEIRKYHRDVLKLRIFEGKGYRVYFARERKSIVILSCGGDKSTQDRDIEQAQAYWRTYRR
jgi:putative addiction module killer protein